MRDRAEVEIGGRQFRIPRWVIAIVVVLILAAPAIWAVGEFRSSLEGYSDEQQRNSDIADYQDAVVGVDGLRAGCNRTNVLRQAAWNNDEIDAHSREQAARNLGDSGQAILDDAEKNHADAQALVDAVADAPLKPGSPQSDCVEVYPAPKPPEGVDPIPQKPLTPVPIEPYKPPSN